MAPPLIGDGVSRLVQCVVVMAEGLGRLLSAAKARGAPSTRATAATIGILFIVDLHELDTKEMICRPAAASAWMSKRVDDARYGCHL
jgi:hypothetical protein